MLRLGEGVGLSVDVVNESREEIAALCSLLKSLQRKESNKGTFFHSEAVAAAIDDTLQRAVAASVEPMDEGMHNCFIYYLNIL